MMTKTAVVTGATSFIGRATVQKLKTQGYDVVALRHGVDEGEMPGVGGRARPPGRPDVWIHFAWAGSGSRLRQDKAIQDYNLGMSFEALKLAASLGCAKFLFAGSQAEYGHAQDGSLKKEDGEKAPISEYAKAKLKFGLRAPLRLKVMNSNMQYIHMRIFSAYGPGDHEESLLSSLIGSLLRGDEVFLGRCRQLWDYIHIDDLTEVIFLLCKKAAPGAYNIGSGDIRPLKDYVAEAGRIILGNDASKHLHFDEREDNAEGDADLSPDISCIKALGFQPKVSFEEGVRKLKS